MRVLIALVLVGFLAVPLAAGDQVLAVMASTVQLRVVRLLGTGSCSAFSINGKKGYFLTAWHCVVEADVWVVGDEEKVRVLYLDPGKDLAVFRAPGSRRTALRPAAQDASEGQQVVILGYAHGWPTAPTIKAQVELAYVWFNPNPFDLYTAFKPACYRGMSGGPIFDLTGRVVSIVQRANSQHCFGKPLSEILDSTGKYWE